MTILETKRARLKKVTLNGTEIPKCSQNSILFSKIFQKGTLPGTREGEKRYLDQRSIPVPLFAQVPPPRVSHTFINRKLYRDFIEI